MSKASPAIRISGSAASASSGNTATPMLAVTATFARPMEKGGAMVSQEHGNFIVNKGGATADDILRLIGRIRERALTERGIELKTEVQIIGGEGGHA